MARWQITVSHSSVGSLAVGTFAGTEGYSRSLVNRASLNLVTPWGTPVISGGAAQNYYQWAITADLSENDYLTLSALAQFQDSTYKANGDGKLILIDEVERVYPMTGTHNITLFSSETASFSASYITGFGQFNILLNLPEDGLEHLGQRKRDRTIFKRVQFEMVQLI